LDLNEHKLNDHGKPQTPTDYRNDI